MAVTFSAYMFNFEANPPGPEPLAIVQILSQKKLLGVWPRSSHRSLQGIVRHDDVEDARL